MSKMRVPEMDVVRFKESDVIVASGAALASIKLFGFANTTKNDGTMTYKGTTYNGNNYNDLISALTGDNLSNNIVVGSSLLDIGNLFTQDKKGNNKFTSNYTDGTYIWDSSEDYFTKQ